jgi:hypothetical protein
MGIVFGMYLGVGICTFIVVGFFCILGGKESDLWKPFIVGAGWPIMLPIYLVKKKFFKK